MLSSIERKLEKLSRVLDNLAFELSRGVPMIVEGKKDIDALRRLEITGDIIPAKTAAGGLLDLLNEVEKRGKSEVILLMDFDRRGREWMKRLTSNFEEMKIKPNTVFWRKLLTLVGRDVKDVEGLSSYIITLKRKIGEDTTVEQ